ncbi:MAG TPA: hypothetical protein VGB79_09685 [Allosphingosinicella sp.]|jgi:hypothetical protein
MSGLLSLTAAALLAAPASYDCTLDPPRALHGGPGEERASAIEIPDVGPLRFTIDVTDTRQRGLEAEVRWPGNPFHIAGRTAALATGRGAIAFVAMARGPCLFAEDACLTLVNLVDETPRLARVVLTPNALITDQAGMRRPFTVLLTGTCVRSESNR